MAAIAVTAGAALSSCGSSSHFHPVVVGPTAWRLPPVLGPPSVTSFCQALAAADSHLTAVRDAKNPTQFEQILVDYADATPTVIATAPPEIAPVVRVYLTATGQLLQALADDGLNYRQLIKHLPPQLKSLQASPQLTTQFDSYVTQNCHFSATNPNSVVPPTSGTTPTT